MTKEIRQLGHVGNNYSQWYNEEGYKNMARSVVKDTFNIGPDKLLSVVLDKDKKTIEIETDKYMCHLFYTGPIVNII